MFYTGLRANAQSVSGRVFDENKKPTPYTNIIVLSAKDSTSIVGTTTADDGSFNSKEVTVGNILKASFVGYKPFTTVLSNQDNLTIVLKEDAKMMKEVVAKGNVPLHKMAIGGIQTNVGNTILDKLGICEDAFAHVPGLMKKKDGYEVSGRGTSIICISGRQMRDAAELERLKSSDIKGAEVISNPGSRYSAAVRAVVKIRAKKAVGDGFGFDVRPAYYQSENIDLSERLNWKYRHKHSELFGGHAYSLDNGNYPSTITTIIHADVLWQQDSTQKVTERNSNFKNTIGADY